KLMGGFLTFFLAFLFREHPLGGLPTSIALTAVVGAYGLGNAVGTAVGNLLKDKRPELIAGAFLVANAAMALLTALLYSPPTVIITALVAGLSTQMAKLGYNALVQREVAGSVQTSVFARSEAVFQMLWVLGG